MRPHDLPEHKLDSVKSSLYPSVPRRVKRAHAANQMKRVQRVEDSLAQVWGRAAPNGLPAENTAKPMRSRKNALCLAADSVLRSLRSPRSPVPSFSVGIAIKKRTSPK